MEPLGFLLGAGVIYKFLQNRKKSAAPLIPGSSAIGPGAAGAAGSPGVGSINDLLMSPGPASYSPAGGAQMACRTCPAKPLPTNPTAPLPVAPVRAPLPVAPLLVFSGGGYEFTGSGSGRTRALTYY